MLVLLDCSASCDPKLHAHYATWRWQELRLMDDSENGYGATLPSTRSLASFLGAGGGYPENSAAARMTPRLPMNPDLLFKKIGEPIFRGKKFYAKRHP
jgi:hypothetical protein